MPYQVKLEVFEGPFDLLLSLISRHKVNIYDISVAQIAEEYLGYLDEMRQLDLEIASEFVLVAATLLEIKSAGLLPQARRIEDDDVLTAFEQRQLLIGRLIEYRKFKNAGQALASRDTAERHFYTRQAALEPQFDQLLPDFLAGIDVQEFGILMRELLDRERIRLIDSSHIATIKISVEAKLEEVITLLGRAKRLFFKELTKEGKRSDVVATFLALLELYKRGLIDIRQADVFGDIEIIKSKIN